MADEQEQSQTFEEQNKRWQDRQSLFEGLQDEDMRHTLKIAEIDCAYHQALAEESRFHGEVVQGLKEPDPCLNDSCDCVHEDVSA